MFFINNLLKSNASKSVLLICSRSKKNNFYWSRIWFSVFYMIFFCENVE
uniref:Uncharacterized protein n=1 Tax=Mesocestoides corti TaxID=53468 RepID=A0A5K3FVN3_MESCO